MTTETISTKLAAHKARLAELAQVAQSLQAQYQQAQVEAYERNGAISALQELLDSAPSVEPANPPQQVAPATEGLTNAE